MTEQEIKIALQQGAIPIGMPKGYDFDQAVTQSAIDAAEDARRSQEAAEAAAGSANRSKNEAEAAANRAAVSKNEAADSAANAAISAASAANSATAAASNAQVAINANTAAQAAASSASDSASQAAASAGGSQHWADLAYNYTDQLRHALGNMFEYDANADIQLVEDPLTGTDPSWELDSNNDVMPVA